jgi:peroxiredoxin Q/BCP
MDSIEQLREGTRPWGSATLCQRRIPLDGRPGGGIQDASRWEKPRMLQVGERAPDFTARTHDGGMLRLADLRGHKVLLWFYPKADTPGCIREGGEFRDKWKEFKDRGVHVVGVSFDTVEENAAFARKFSLPFPLLCDTEKRIGLAYGVCSSVDAPFPRRVSYLIDEHGSIAQAYDKVSPDAHPGEVLAALR